MRKSYALYRKEIKGNFSLFVIPIVLMVVAIVSQYVHFNILSQNLYFDIFSTKQIPKLLAVIRIIAEVSFILMPLLFLYAISLEEKRGTIYQLHLLPLRGGAILWYKFIAALSYIVIWALLNSINRNMPAIISGAGATQISITRNPELWIRPFSSSIAINTGYISLIVLAWGAAFTIRRYRQITGVAAFVFGGVCVLQVSQNAFSRLTPILRSHNILDGRHATRDVPLTLTLIFCLGLLYVGLMLYERYSEL